MHCRLCTAEIQLADMTCSGLQPVQHSVQHQITFYPPLKSPEWKKYHCEKTNSGAAVLCPRLSSTTCRNVEMSYEARETELTKEMVQ